MEIVRGHGGGGGGVWGLGAPQGGGHLHWTVPLLPGGEVNQGDSDCVTRDQRVTENVEICKKILLVFKFANIGEGVLNASGCMSLM